MFMWTFRRHNYSYTVQTVYSLPLNTNTHTYSHAHTLTRPLNLPITHTCSLLLGSVDWPHL